MRKEVKTTFFDEYGKQWWTTNRDADYRCNLLQEVIDKEIPKKVVICSNCDYGLYGTPYGKYCTNCGQKLMWSDNKMKKLTRIKEVK